MAQSSLLAGCQDEVVDFLESSESFFAARGGSGNALKKALKDQGPVIRVEWHTKALGGMLGRGGIRHVLQNVTILESKAREIGELQYRRRRAAWDRLPVPFAPSCSGLCGNNLLEITTPFLFGFCPCSQRWCCEAAKGNSLNCMPEVRMCSEWG